MDHLPFSPVFVIFAFASLNESIIEYFVGSVQPLRSYLPLLALASSIFLVFTYQIDIFTSVLGMQTNTPFLDYLLTAFIISRGSNFVNDFVRRVLGSK